MFAPVLIAVVVPLAVGASAVPAAAHSAGKAVPKIGVESRPVDPSGGLTHEITVTVSDADSSQPVQGAEVTVEASMSVPHSMTTLPVELAERGQAGVYVGRLRYPMPAEWTLHVKISGEKVREASAEMPVSVKLTGSSSAQSSGEGTGEERTVRPSLMVSGRLSGSDALPVGALVAHSSSAAAWVIATLLLVLAAHPRTSRWFSEDARRAVLARRSRVRLAASISGALLVLTGIANGLVAAPFRLVPTISSIRSAMSYPFGNIYLLVLAGKIVLLVAIVLVNRIPCRDTEDSMQAAAGSAARFALGADLLLFPALLVLVVLLKYLHVLVHVSAALGP